MTLELTPAARERLADIGFDPDLWRASAPRRSSSASSIRWRCGCSPATFHDGDSIIVDVEGDQFAFRS